MVGMVFGNRQVSFTDSTAYISTCFKVGQFVKNFPTICLSEGEECMNRLFMTKYL